MFCYNVVDDCIICRSFKKRASTDEDLVQMVKNITGASNVMCCEKLPENCSLFEACKALTPLADEAEKCTWFVSVSNDMILALAIVATLGRNHLWELLNSEDTFNEWIRKNVR